MIVGIPTTVAAATLCLTKRLRELRDWLVD
jgi:hypothetical protein